MTAEIWLGTWGLGRSTPRPGAAPAFWMRDNTRQHATTHDKKFQQEA
jgi:hypothetical protein